MAIKIGELLLKEGLISQGQLEEALKYQVIFGGRLGTNFIEMGIIEEEEILNVLSKKIGVPVADTSAIMEVPESVIAKVPKELAEKYKVVPMQIDGRRLTLAMEDPQDLKVIDEISFRTGLIVKPVIALELRLVLALEKYYDIPRERRYIDADKKVQKRRRPAERGKKPAPPPAAKAKPKTAPPKAVEDDPFAEALKEETPIPPSPKAPAPVVEKKEQEKPAPVVVEKETPVVAEPAPPVQPPEEPSPEETPAPASFDEELLELDEIEELDELEEVADVEEDEEEEILEAEELVLVEREDVPEHLAEAYDRDDILDTVTGCLAREFPRCAVYLVRGDAALGWKAAINGEAIPGFDQSEIPLDEASVLKTVAETRSYLLGPIPRTPFNSMLLQDLGGEVPPVALLVPMQMLGRVVGIIYVDGKGVNLGDKLIELQKLTAKASMAFEILVLKSKILSL